MKGRKKAQQQVTSSGQAQPVFTAVQANFVPDREGCFRYKIYRDGDPLLVGGRFVTLKANSVEHAIQCAQQLYALDVPMSSRALSVEQKPNEKPLKDDIDMAVLTNTGLRIGLSAEDANVVNDMYMVLCRFLKIGSGDAKLVKDGGDVIDRYRGKK